MTRNESRIDRERLTSSNHAAGLPTYNQPLAPLLVNCGRVQSFRTSTSFGQETTHNRYNQGGQYLLAQPRKFVVNCWYGLSRHALAKSTYSNSSLGLERNRGEFPAPWGYFDGSADKLSRVRERVSTAGDCPGISLAHYQELLQDC